MDFDFLARQRILEKQPSDLHLEIFQYGYGSIPINTIFSGMNIHLPAILGFTRYQGFDPSAYVFNSQSAQHWR